VKPDGTWTGRAPGRVNLIGEHVDYLGGKVLPCAIDRFTTSTGAPAAEWEVISPVPDGLRFVRAVGERLDAPPQRVRIESSVPPSAGGSSSAALLVSVAAGLRPELSGVAAALACQAAEQAARGVLVGVMDQFAAALGRAGHALLLDCGTLEYRYVPFPPTVLIAVIESGVDRDLAHTPYNLRRKEAESGLPKRIRHVESELRRVDAFVGALERGDLPALGRLLEESHASLRDDFEVSTPEIDALVERASAHRGCLGARIMGAGFGGSVLALVEAGREGGLESAVGGPVLFCQTADGAYVS